jgi:hypothetical protein
VVGSTVNNHSVGRHLCGDLAGLAVRQGQENDVVPGQVLGRGVGEG